MPIIPSRPIPFVLVTGGCRSGKSAYAQTIAEKLAHSGLYLATAQVCDDEMRLRVRRHQAARGPNWRLHELAAGEGMELWRRLPSLVRPEEALLFDCLTLWTAGCMVGEEAPDDFSETCDNLLRALWALPCPVVLVNNEVGMGVVPGTAAGRAFRDMAGEIGQRAAALATSVILVVSGLPLVLKGSPLNER